MSCGKKPFRNQRKFVCPTGGAEKGGIGQRVRNVGGRRREYFGISENSEVTTAQHHSLKKKKKKKKGAPIGEEGKR